MGDTRHLRVKKPSDSDRVPLIENELTQEELLAKIEMDKTFAQTNISFLQKWIHYLTDLEKQVLKGDPKEVMETYKILKT